MTWGQLAHQHVVSDPEHAQGAAMAPVYPEAPAPLDDGGADGGTPHVQRDQGQEEARQHAPIPDVGFVQPECGHERIWCPPASALRPGPQRPEPAVAGPPARTKPGHGQQPGHVTHASQAFLSPFAIHYPPPSLPLSTRQWPHIILKKSPMCLVSGTCRHIFHCGENGNERNNVADSAGYSGFGSAHA